ncbi:hypothetical protein [Xenophilus sp. Marseille-Q4582]|uniref:hypothetical protein n=1 Tax=Xenophilus sp. Marseille-Q4582 TaxID=2866600 RepID=UPI001CE3D1A6|nr:hypothetical protein [Xenophilus sp. Marseille-Q4582]
MTDKFKALRDALAGVEHAGTFSKSGRTVQVAETDEWAAIHVEVRANKLIAPKLARYIAEANPDTIRALLAEVEALRKKAARYDWLRDNWGYVSETYDGTRCESVYLVSRDDGWDTDPESLDAAIDVALRAKEGSRG